MYLSNVEVGHFKYLLEELLFRLKDDEALVISDLEDEILNCAEILGLEPNLERDNKDDYGY